MNKSTTTKAARKTNSNTKFPLHKHATGRWAKKVRGKRVYFGKVSDDPDGQTALVLWLDQRDDLLAGRTPRVSGDGLTVKTLFDKFMAAKESLVDTREITRRHFDDLYSACKIAVAHFGKQRLVDDLASDDFEALRRGLAKTRGAWALGGMIQKVRSVFKYGYEAGLIDKPVRYGPSFKRPGKNAIRREKDDKGPNLFDVKEVRAIIAAASQPMKAMVLLGINCGLGNSDCGQLKFRHVDTMRSWLNFPRPKTGVARKIPLWPETVKALLEAIDHRKEHRDDADKDLVFITKYGRSWHKDKRGGYSLGHEFSKLLDKLELRREGLGFYTLRHTFRTQADATRDFPAIDRIMGHADNTMASHYREELDDARLIAVTEHVRKWLFPRGRKVK